MKSINDGLQTEFRDAALEAFDVICARYDMPKIIDADLPGFFKSIDAMAARLWTRKQGSN